MNFLKRGSSRILIFTGLLILVFGIVRQLTGANDITASGASSATLRLTIPLLLAGLGGLWSERSGIVNIGLEGMMILGTFGAGWAGWQWGPWAGVLSAVLYGVIGFLS